MTHPNVYGAPSNHPTYEELDGSYECRYCERKKDIDGGTKRNEPSWCESCETVRSHKKVPEQ